jgi:copper chaperone
VIAGRCLSQSGPKDQTVIVQLARKDNIMATGEYQVTGMTCGHCEMSVREEVGGIEDVEQVDVSAATGRLVVTSTEPIDDAAVVAAVDEAGYTAVRV